ncbi:MAG: DUF1295 domain-containing protein [Phycisphaerales bacterium]
MTWWHLLLAAWAANALLMAGLWAVATRRKNVGVVDVAWSFATGLTGVGLALLVAPAGGSRRWLVAGLAAVWGIRLGSHLARRVAAEAEDCRYAEMRSSLGERFNAVMFGFFQIQATWAVMFAAPMMVAAMRPGDGLDAFDVAGLLVWCIGIGGEAVADGQLSRFKRAGHPRTAVCREGLWAYSRHPNYFFEWIHWFAYVLIAVGSPGIWPWGWLSLLGPAVMLVFLLKVTGVPPAERSSLKRRGEAYRIYQQEVNAFFPGPRRLADGART